MKKIAILTINDDTNVGNRLQNYAVQETLKKLNFTVETIENKLNLAGIRYIKKIFKCFIKLLVSPINKTYIRYIKYNLFNIKYIKYSKYKIDKNHIPSKLSEKYDAFVTGSDQVWNPNFGRMSDIDFLTFAPKDKRNSFSASFGISSIPDNMKEYYKTKLLGIKNISVREERAKEIVMELTERNDVEVLLDPTMMLSAEEWNLIIRKPKKFKNNRYVLNYFLGNINDEINEKIKKIAEENNCTIINVLDINNPLYAIDPSEFLYLIKNAFLVCTDSFHGSVFSILYNRPFIVYDRQDEFENMNSRIETLLNKFKLTSRKYDGKITKELLEVDYNETYQILEEEREKTYKFLKKF